MPYLGFGKEEDEAVKAKDRAGPIHMLNRVKLREPAVCEDGPETSGKDTYGRLSDPVYARLGGRIVRRRLQSPGGSVWPRLRAGTGLAAMMPEASESDAV